MSIAQVESFLKGVNSTTFQSQKYKIYKFIKRNPNCTIEDINFFSTGMKKETIVGRVSELCDLGVVKYNGIFKSRSGNNSKLIVVEDKQEQIRLFKERTKSKRDKAIKVLLSRFKDSLKPETVEQLMVEVL